MAERPNEPFAGLSEAQKEHLIVLIETNEDLPEPEVKINSKKTRANQSPETYPFTLVRLTDPSGARYLVKYPIADRENMPGANGKFSQSQVQLAVQPEAICPQRVNRFIKSITVKTGLSAEQIQRSADVTKAMLPNTQFVKTADNKFLLIMDYLEGKDLYDTVAFGRLERLEIKDLDYFAEQIFRQLNRLHEKFKYLHCDLKAENVMIVDDMTRAVVIDYDYASPINESRSSSGSLLYAAPEVIRGAKNSKASDIYSFGMVLFMLYARYKGFMALRELEQSILALNNFSSQRAELLKFKESTLNYDYVQSFLPSGYENLARLIANFCHPSCTIRLQQWQRLVEANGHLPFAQVISSGISAIEEKNIFNKRARNFVSSTSEQQVLKKSYSISLPALHQ